MVKIQQAIGRNTPFVKVQAPPIIAQRAPTTTDTNYPKGASWIDESVSPSILYFHLGGGDWNSNELTLSTDDTFAAPSDSTASSSLAIKTYVDGVAIAGAPIATEITQGIGYTASEAQVLARTANTATEAYFVSPEDLDAMFASPSAIGGTAASTGTFTDLTADGTGAVSLGSNAAADFTVSSGDLTLAASTNSVIITAAEAVADAINIDSTGGFDLDAALLIALTSSRNNAQAILVESTAGGIDILASGSGGSGEDIDIICTGGSVNVSGTENVADAITISAANGGIDITCGGAAGEDIDLVNTAGSIHLNAGEAVSDAINIDSSGGVDVDAAGQINIASSQNASDAVSINASAGGIEIIAVGAATEDIVLQNTNGSVNVVAGEADAAAMSMQAASGGLDLDCALSVDIASSQAAATAIQIDASNAAGGITMSAGTGGILIGNQADCTTIDIGDLAPTASRTITIGGGTVVTASVTDLIDIAPDGATTNADSIKQVDINTGTIATGQSLTNIATGAITSGTHTVEIQSGNAAAGTVACNISTGTGTKTVSVGNADGLTTTAILGPLNVNASQNNDVNICTGTSTGAVSIGNTAAGAMILNSASTITIGDASAGAIAIDTAAGISIDAATASNLTCAAGDMTVAATTGSVVINGEEAVVDAVQLTSTAGGITIDSALASADAINLSASAGGVDIDGALQVNIASSQADPGALTLSVSDASGGITHTGKCIYTPDAITSDNAGVAASVSTKITEITTDGDSNEDNVTLADGVDGQVKIFAVVAAGNAADSVKITPANMIGGTKITFAADPTGLGCMMIFDSGVGGWCVVGNNGGTIA